jgi:hypothetical protein
VVKLDKDGKAYQEVKVVKYNILAKADPNPPKPRKKGGEAKKNIKAVTLTSPTSNPVSVTTTSLSALPPSQ